MTLEEIRGSDEEISEVAHYMQTLEPTIGAALEDFYKALLGVDVAVFANVGFQKIGRLAMEGTLAARCHAEPQSAQRLADALQKLTPYLVEALPGMTSHQVEIAIDATKSLIVGPIDALNHVKLLCLGVLSANLSAAAICEQIVLTGDPLEFFGVQASKISARH